MQENESIIELGFHPSTRYKKKWKILQFFFVVLVVTGIIWDFVAVNPPFVDQDYRIRWLRIALAFFCIMIYSIFLVLEYRWFDLRDKEEVSQSVADKLWKVAFDLTKHVDNLYQQRINFILVAESMLIVSFVTTLLIAIEDKKLYIFGESIRIFIAILGMVFTFSWFYVNKRLDWRLVYLTHRFLKKSPSYSSLYKEYLAIPDKFARPNSGFFLSNILPTFIFAFWYFVLYMTRWQ